MGAFFLYRSGANLNLPAVEAIFDAKGFSQPDIYPLGADWVLYSYGKQLVVAETFYSDGAGNVLFAFGTFAYRGFGRRESMAAVLKDYLKQELDQDALNGAYGLLICTAGNLAFVTDRMNLFHVFTNEEQSVFSSSFAAMLNAAPGLLSLNGQAVIENALTGYVIGPETMVSGVYLVDEQHRQKIHCPKLVFLPHKRDELIYDAEPSGGFSECVTKQLESLDLYFRSFKALATEAGGMEVGLSGGYDSRLLILLARRHFGTVTAHTHYHRKTTVDETVAQQVAAALEIPLKLCEAAKQPAEMEQNEFEANLANAAPFSDMRVVHDYSWLSYFRTRTYREIVLQDGRFAMNGLAGELYRNHDNHLQGICDAREWVKARVMGPGVFSSVLPRTLEASIDHTLAKAAKVLGEPVQNRITHRQTRRYFGEIFSVYGAAVRLNTDNQLAYSLSPFMDYPLRGASYRALPYLGLAGRFEAEMIRRLDPSVAAIASSYGRAFDSAEPAGRRIKYAARGLLPYRWQNTLTPVRMHQRAGACPVYGPLLQRQPLIRQAVELMRDPRFGFKWERVIQHDVLLQRVLSLGIMLIKNQDCIRL